jgi:DNA polymerase epsilon subunit 2
LVPQLQEYLIDECDSSMVMLSDVWLDRPETFVKLETLLSGLEIMDPPPVALVLLGDFSSKTFGSDRHDSILFRERFDKLGALLARSHALKDCQVVVVPGPGDPSLGPSVCLPRPRMPNSLTRGLSRWLGDRLHLLSNPARIRYCTLSIVLFRENLISSLYRHSIRPPLVQLPDSDRTIDRNQHVVKTLLDQAHLCPLSLGVRPIFWPSRCRPLSLVTALVLFS